VHCAGDPRAQPVFENNKKQITKKTCPKYFAFITDNSHKKSICFGRSSRICFLAFLGVSYQGGFKSTQQIRGKKTTGLRFSFFVFRAPLASCLAVPGYLLPVDPPEIRVACHVSLLHSLRAQARSEGPVWSAIAPAVI
jgi:hypothetical protein